jgi:hypothetical protein
MGFAESPKHVTIVGGPIKYYTSYGSTNLYVQRLFAGDVNTLTIYNTHATDVAQFSYDGVTLHGDLEGKESITVHTSGSSCIYLKSTDSTATIRIWGT